MRAKNKSTIVSVMLIIISVIILMGFTFVYFVDVLKPTQTISLGKISLSVNDKFSTEIKVADAVPGDKLTDRISFSKENDSSSIYVRVLLDFKAKDEGVGLSSFVDELNENMSDALTLRNSDEYQWFEASSKVYYLVTQADSLTAFAVEDNDEYFFTDNIFLSRSLEQEVNYGQYMQQIVLNVQIQAIQALNVEASLSNVDQIFGELFGNSVLSVPSFDYFTIDGQTIKLTGSSDEKKSIVVPTSYSVEQTVQNAFYVKEFTTESEVEEFKEGVNRVSLTGQSNTEQSKDAVNEWYNQWVVDQKPLPVTFTYDKVITTYVDGNDFDITTLDLTSVPTWCQVLIIPETITTIKTSDSIILLNDGPSNLGEIGGVDTGIGGGIVIPPIITPPIISDAVIIDPIEASLTVNVSPASGYLEQIIVADNNPNYDSRDNCNAVIEKATHKLMVGCVGTIIPDSVTSIDDKAFYSAGGNVDSEFSITIPDNIESIGTSAFSNPLITDVIISESSKLNTIGSNAFASSNITEIFIPKEVNYVSEDAFSSCINLTSVTVDIANSTYSSGNNSHYLLANDAGSLLFVNKAITSLPEGLKVIKEQEFMDCVNLSGIIEISSEVVSIGAEAFKGCTAITGFVVADTNSVYDSRQDCNAIIDTLNNSLIAGCANTTIPNNVVRIERSAFYGVSMNTISLPASLESVGMEAFYGSGLTGDLVIPNGVTTIEMGAFDGCQFDLIIVPATVTDMSGLYAVASTTVYSIGQNYSGNSNFDGTAVPPAHYVIMFTGGDGEISRTLYKFNANYHPEETSAVNGVTYTSTNTEVATVDSNTGVVTLVGGGETTIVASFTIEGYTVSYSYTIVQ